jgi:hypothetical protein
MERHSNLFGKDGWDYRMKKFIFVFLIFTVCLSAMDLSFLKIEKIVLDNGKVYDEQNYTQANGKGKIYYEYIGLPPLEYNHQTGKFEFNKHDIEMGFILGFNARYQGEIKNGTRNGYGILESKLRLKYEGNWEDNKFHGKGTLFQERSGFNYEGNFVDGVKEGQGHLSDYLSINLNKEHTKYSLKYDEINFPDSASYKLHLIGNFKNDLASNSAECYLINIEDNSKQKCIFKDGKLQSKIKLPYELAKELKKSKKRIVTNTRIADETLKAISVIHTDIVYVVAETNMKDAEKVKVTFFILGENDEVLVTVRRTAIVKKSQIVEEFDIPKILKENKISKDRLRSLDATLEWDD